MIRSHPSREEILYRFNTLVPVTLLLLLPTRLPVLPGSRGGRFSISGAKSLRPVRSSETRSACQTCQQTEQRSSRGQPRIINCVVHWFESRLEPERPSLV